MRDQVIHLTGPVVADDATTYPEAWVVGGELALTRPTGAAEARVIGGWVLPGLVDVHSHIGLAATGPATRGETRAQALADRDSGVLLVRDAGQQGDTRWVDGETDLPRLIRCGRHLARPRRYIRHIARELGAGGSLAPGELAAAAVEECRRGDGWVKLVGDWIDRDLPVPDLAPLWSDEELGRAAEAVHAAGGRLTIHVFTREGARQALDAGFDCVEHGCGMDGPLMARAAAAGVPVVPTMLQRGEFDAIRASGAAKYPAWAEHFARLYAERETQARALFAAGVPLLLGSDQGTSIPHGSAPAEAAAMVAAGLPAAAVVAAATWQARRFLGRPGIADGAPADVVVYAADPRRDIGQLARPRAVILRGRVVAGAVARQR